MNPLLDQLAVAAAVTGAVAFFVRRFLRKRAAGKSCGSDCGCAADQRAIKGPVAAKKNSRQRRTAGGKWE